MACWEIVVLAVAGCFLVLPLAVVDYLIIGASVVTAEADRQQIDSD